MSSISALDTNIEPAAVLEIAKEACLDDVLVIGWDSSGEIFVSGSSTSLPENYWLLGCAKKWMINFSQSDGK